MLVAELDKTRVEASTVERGPVFVCPNCKAVVVLKKGRIVVHHFAHKPPVSCTWASGETRAHLTAKTVIKEGFQARGLRAEVEVEVISAAGDRRADVLVWSPKAPHRAAIEVQHQPLSFDAIARRTVAYMVAKTPVAWVSLLNAQSWEHAKAVGDHFVINKYSVRPWERWAHSYGMGELWFFDAVGEKLWRGVLKAHIIEVPMSSWYNSDGSEEYAGGYERTSRRWRKLHLYGPYEPSRVALKVHKRKPWQGKHFDVPGGWAARMTLLES